MQEFGKAPYKICSCGYRNHARCNNCNNCGLAFEKKKLKAKKKIIEVPECDLPLFFHIEDFMEQKFKVCQNLVDGISDDEEYSLDYLSSRIQEDPKINISLMRLIVGISNDKWEELILHGLPYDLELQVMCNYVVWPKYSKGANIAMPKAELSELEKYIRDNKDLARGISLLFFRGASLKASKNFWCLSDCKFSMIKEFKSHSKDWQRRIIRDRIAGSYDEISGTYRERFCQGLLADYATSINRLDVKVGKSFDREELPVFKDYGDGKGRLKSKDLFPNLTGQDLIVLDLNGNILLVAEISVQRGTGSGITSKSTTIKRGLSKCKRQYSNTVFGLVVGGHGWQSRQADLRNIIKYMDKVWYYTSDGLANMLVDFSLKLNHPILKEDAILLVNKKHQEFCQEVNWKKYCHIDLEKNGN